MKKTYINPTLQIVKVNCELMVATSFGKNDTGADADVVLVKGESSSSRGNYSVWDDDWSAE